MLCLFLISCSVPVAAPMSPAAIPVTGSGGAFQVHEYALVEASTDNPSHVEFQQRAITVVTASRSPWSFLGAGDIFQAPNQAMAPYGYHLAANPTPPFSGFALYHGAQLVQRDIARFSPVSVKDTSNGDDRSDFTFPFVTISGKKFVANINGIQPLPGQDQTVSRIPNYGNAIAYTNTVGSEAGLLTGTLLADEEIPPGAYGFQDVAGQPLYFYPGGDLVHLNYAGRDLAYTYDRVIHDNTGSLAIFNPGGTGQISWFYALRDGLWYYVEAGVFN